MRPSLLCTLSPFVEGGCVAKQHFFSVENSNELGVQAKWELYIKIRSPVFYVKLLVGVQAKWELYIKIRSPVFLCKVAGGSPS